MSNQCITDILSVTEKRIDTAFEMPVEREILLADYDKPVFKIIRTITEHSLTHKYVNGNRLIIEGFLRTSVFYQPPGGETITVVSKKQPFQKQLDLAEPVTDAYFITVNGQRQYVNTRAVNPTRIAVNGVYQFTVLLYTAGKTAVTTAIKSETVCTDTHNITAFALAGQGSRQFSMEDEISLNENTDKILHIVTCPVNVSAIAYKDKVNIKGEVEAQILYTVKQQAGVHTAKKKFAFNQLADIQGTAENNICFADISVINTTVTANQESSRFNCAVTAVCDVKVFRKNTILTVADAFSRKYTTEKTFLQAQYDQNIHNVNKTVSYTVEDTLTDTCTPVCCFVELSKPEVVSSQGKYLLKTTGNINAIVINRQNEYECFTRTVEITIDTGREIAAHNKYIVECNVQDRSVTVNGNNLKIDFTVVFSGFVLCTEENRVVDSFAENTRRPLERRDNSLIIYYGKKGEKIFDIAMKYNTDTRLIKNENNLSEEYLDSDKMLIVPSFGM